MMASVTPCEIRDFFEERVQYFEPEGAQNIEPPHEFRMQAFDLQKEWINYREGKITNEQGLYDQLARFIEEYLTLKSIMSFRYDFNEHDQLVSEGWRDPMEITYSNALNEYALPQDIFEVREAELESFLQVQEFMQEQKQAQNNQIAWLISPAENYNSPYAFVSFYELKIDENGNYYVEARNVKTYRSKNQLANLRDKLMSDSNARYYRSPQDKGTNDPVSMLEHVLTLEKNFDVDGLIIELSKQDAFDSKEVDKTTQLQMQSFEPEIRGFLEIFMGPNTTYEIAQQYFKMLLVKAKIHFDLEAAKSLWQDQIQVVNDISKASFVGTGANSIFTNDVFQDIMGLQMQLTGSCGDLTFSSTKNLGVLSIEETLRTLRSSYTIPGQIYSVRSETRPDESRCSRCGCLWFVKNGNSSTYLPCCPGCGADAGCEIPKLQDHRVHKEIEISKN